MKLAHKSACPGLQYAALKGWKKFRKMNSAKVPDDMCVMQNCLSIGNSLRTEKLKYVNVLASINDKLQITDQNLS